MNSYKATVCMRVGESTTLLYRAPSAAAVEAHIKSRFPRWQSITIELR